MLTMPIEDILKVIRENKDFRKDFATKADSIVDKIYIFYSKPSSKSKEEIIEWINSNIGITNELIKKHDIVTETPIFMSEAPKVNVKVIQNEVNSNPIDVPSDKDMKLKYEYNPKSNILKTLGPSRISKVGKIITIDRSEKAYRELIETSIKEMWIYRGCTITTDIIDNKAVWLVFFY